MGKERVQTRVDPDTANRVEEYRADHDLTKSEAARRLVYAGLAEKGYPAEDVAPTSPGLTDSRRFWATLISYFVIGLTVTAGVILGPWAAFTLGSTALVSYPVARYVVAPAIVRLLPEDGSSTVEVPDDA